MPQMAPLNWLTLMTFFIMIVLIFNSMNFFSFIYPIKNSKSLQKKTTLYNWKW
uniref:ATP synthase complex subunit 8 n=1 Tax=Callosobruchus maculatus TaxID=64391 RepID=A0A343KPW7_CALMS|nr:ATP synthase F0 subunit 8 [Callosobruchus maculatus]ATL15439.1 ATP synthase F0 subunit 8 [Callosobruchus maculatus]ATL15452.1 ATP synthase F0 subunit 8 [Callosobruchus maculatus]ATL15465.1 ATP synthase F0 subunit 8 [Callosobruchus maculatus]